MKTKGSGHGEQNCRGCFRMKEKLGKIEAKIYAIGNETWYVPVIATNEVGPMGCIALAVSRKFAFRYNAGKPTWRGPFSGAVSMIAEPRRGGMLRGGLNGRML